jgi:hypothetical protein
MHTPAKALEAMADPAPLTLGQVALLDLYKLPILKGNIDDLSATVFAVWLLSMPLEQAVVEAHYPERAFVWAEKIGVVEYNDHLVQSLNAIAAFNGMLPKAESGEDEDEDDPKALKKKSGAPATETSRKSRSASAASTAGRFTTFFARFLPSRWRSSTAAGCRLPEA